MLDIIFDILSLIGDALLFLPSRLKRKREISQEWSGTVEEKSTFPSLSRHRYSVVFQTLEGKRKKLRMEKADFELYQQGRIYTKKAGEYLPDPHTAA
jgi:hypothetical protein